MLGLLGKKLGITQVFNDAGEPVPVTIIKAGPCTIVQRKTAAKEGYESIQVGFEVLEDKKVKKPQATKPFRHVCEFKPKKFDGLEVGKDVTVGIFKKGDLVDVSGVTKGKGYQGVIKRWGKSGGPAAHGSKFHRTTGSIGMRTWPGRVLAGTGMAGHMGAVNRKIRHLEVVGIDAEQNVLLIKGAVPGANNGLVVVSTKAL